MTRLLARLDGEQLRRYWFAKPIVTAMLPHISEDGLKDIVNNANKPSGGPNISSRALMILLDEYIPTFMKAEVSRSSGGRGAEPLPGLPVQAARGIMASYSRGDFNANLVWVGVNPYFGSISATAAKGDKA